MRLDLEVAQKLEPGNESIENELARLEWAEKKSAKVLFTLYFFPFYFFFCFAFFSSQ